ncbi:hypothetical protein HBI33_029570 [Parastagonospora nodorum]|nr:hypothetical protein HBI33_029570 [Parastagonospora nodorum]
MAGRNSDDDKWYKSKANTTSSNSMLQTNVREGYRITTLEVVELIEDLISYLLKSLRLLTLKDWLAVAKCIRLRNAQIPKVFHEAAAGTIWTMMLAKVRYNTLTLTLSETAQRQSSSVVSNRSTALITDKFSVALLTEPAILNDANVALVDAVYYSVQKLEENYFEVRAQHLKYDVIDALTMTLIKDDDDLLGTVNSYIKSRRLRARCKTEAADSRYAKASGGRTKKDKDLEDSDTGSDRLGKEAQLKKTRDEEELAKLDGLLDSDDYRLDSSLDIDPEDDSEDEEATIAKDLAREQKERLKALLNAKTRDSLSARVGTAIEHCTLEEWTSAAVFFGLTDAYILYFKELLSDNSGIFANAMGIGKTRAIVLAVLIGHVYFKNWTEVQNARAEGDAIEHNAVDDDDKLCPTEGERTFYCAWGRAADAWKNEVVAIDLANSTWCDLSDPLALRFCFFSDSPPENMGRLTKEEAMEMRIDTTNAISKALAAANKLVASRSYVLGGVDHRETVYWIIPEANTPAVHPKATKHRLALLAARFVIVCGFRKVDKHVFRAYNTISVTAQRMIIRKGGPYVEKRAILLSDILEKEGLDKSEASRRVIFNCFEMQAIASYPALATLKAAYVKDLFTNLSKDYFLVREARAITKSSPKFQNLLNLCSERDPDGPWIIVALIAFAEAITLTEATHVVIIELQDRQNI